MPCTGDIYGRKRQHFGTKFRQAIVANRGEKVRIASSQKGRFGSKKLQKNDRCKKIRLEEHAKIKDDSLELLYILSRLFKVSTIISTPDISVCSVCLAVASRIISFSFSIR